MTDMELKAAFDEQGKLLKDLRETYDAEVKRNGQVSGETQTKMDRMQARLDELESKLSRPAAAPSIEDKGVEGVKRMDAFKAFLHKGLDGMKSEQKALVTYDDTLGGHLAPPEYVAEIIKDEVEYTPVEQFFTVRNTSRGEIQAPKRTGTFTAIKVAEAGTRSERTGLTYGLQRIPTHMFYALVLASIEDLQDSAFDVEALVREESAEQLGVAKSTSFITGSGIGEAEGILTNGDVSYTASGHASLLDSGVGGDKLVDLKHAVKSIYGQNARWLLNRTTLGKVRLLKNSVGDWLFQQGLAAGNPGTILGDPYTECVEMPDIAANAYPIIYGDLRRAYWAVNRTGLAVQRLNEFYATSGCVGFHVYQRWGGRVVNATAIRKLKIAAS